MLGLGVPPVAQTAPENPMWVLVLGIALVVIFTAMLVYLVWPRHEAELTQLRTGELRRAA